jgi:hypothetical protein
VGNKNDIFALREVRPSLEQPVEFVLEIDDDKTLVTVGKERPYEGVAGYMVDLSYEPERLVFLNRRLDDRLVFGGDTNKIVAIEASSVTVEALSNKKRTTVTTEPPGGGSGTR